MLPLIPGQLSSYTNSVFQEVVFFLTGKISSVTEARMRAGGARKASYLSGLVTHCVAGMEPEEAEIAEAEELLELPVVTEEWVRISSRCGELLPVGGFRVDERKLFSGVVVRVVGLGREDVERIWAMVTWHGGRVVVAEGGMVTHQVTVAGGDGKGGSFWIVTPDWVVDSVKRGQRVEEVMYNTGMVLVPSSRQVAPNLAAISSSSPAWMRSSTSKPVFMKTKYYKSASSSRTLPSTPTVISAILNSSEEESCNNLEASSSLKPQKLSFPVSGVSISRDNNGNSSKLGGRWRLGSITEEDRREVGEESREEVIDSFKNFGADMKELTTGLAEKLKLSDTINEELVKVDKLDSVIRQTEKVKDIHTNDGRIAKECLNVGVRKRSQPSPAKIEVKKENPDKSKRRRSVRLIGKQDGILTALEESCRGKPNLKESAATKILQGPTKKKDKPDLKTQEKMFSPAINKSKSSAVTTKNLPTVSKLKLQSPSGVARKVGKPIKDNGTSSVNLVSGLLDKDFETGVTKVQGEKLNRRRSVRLMSKGK